MRPTKDRKAPGTDKVSNLILKKLPVEVITALNNITREAMKLRPNAKKSPKQGPLE